MWARIVTVVLLAFPLPMAAAVIDVRDQVTVAEGTLLRLKDVARITDVEPIKAAALGEITLQPAPAAGRSQRIGFEELRRRLQAHGVNLAEMEFRGQAVVNVTTAARPALPPKPEPPPRVVATTSSPRVEPPKAVTRADHEQANQRMETVIRRAFRLTTGEMPVLRVSCTVEAADVPAVLLASADKIRFAEQQLPLGDAQSVTAHWTANDGTLHTVVVPVSVELAPRRLAVRRHVPAGVPLQPDDLEWVTGELTPNAVTQLSDVIGKEATRTLRAGTLLEAGLLTPVPLVRANDIVTVQVVRPGIVVRRMFKASSAGALHDTVLLVAVDDPRLKVQAIVTGYHEATMLDPAAPPRTSATPPTTGGEVRR